MKFDNFFFCVIIIEVGNCDILLLSIQLKQKKNCYVINWFFFFVMDKIFLFFIERNIKRFRFFIDFM